MEVICELNKERSHKINKLKDKTKSVFIYKSSKSEHNYWLIIKLKAIKYKEDFFCYLSFYFYYQTSFHTFLSLLSQNVNFFDCLFRFSTFIHSLLSSLSPFLSFRYSNGYLQLSYISYLIRSSVKISSIDYLFTGSFSGYAQELFLFSLIAKLTACW